MVCTQKVNPAFEVVEDEIGGGRGRHDVASGRGHVDGHHLGVVTRRVLDVEGQRPPGHGVAVTAAFAALTRQLVHLCSGRVSNVQNPFNDESCSTVNLHESTFAI